MVMDKYCQLVERETATISVFWKVLHLCALVIAALCSLAVALYLDVIMSAFGQRCILFAKLSFSDELAYETVGTLPENISFHNAQTIWGLGRTCASAKCTYLISMIVAMILFAFFVLTPRGGYSNQSHLYEHAWRLVPPAICMSLIMIIAISIVYSSTTNGLNVFTEQIYTHLMKIGYCTNCEDELNLFTLIYNKYEIDVSDHIRMFIITSTTVLSAWIVLIVSLLLRMLLGVDFQIVVYNIKQQQTLPIDDTGSSVSSDSYHPDDPLPPMKKRKARDVLKVQSNSDEDIILSGSSPTISKKFSTLI